MKRSEIELHGMSQTAERAARERDGAERNRAAWHEPDVREEQPVSEMERSGIELHGESRTAGSAA